MIKDSNKQKEVQALTKSVVTTNQATYDPVVHKPTFTPDTSTFDDSKVKTPLYLQDIIDQAKTQQEEMQNRYKNAVRNSKVLAWGNLIAALGNLAGGGHNTVNPPRQDNNLIRAFNQVDSLRDMYYNSDRNNKTLLNKVQAAATEAERKAYYDRQKKLNDYNYKAETDYAKAQNELEKAKFNAGMEKKTDTFSNDDKMKERALNYKGKMVDIAQKNAEMSAARTQKNNEATEARIQALKNKDMIKINAADNQEYEITLDDARSIYNHLFDRLNQFRKLSSREAKKLNGQEKALYQTLMNDTDLISNPGKSPAVKDEYLKLIAKRYAENYPEEFQRILTKTKNYGFISDIDDLIED